MKIIIGAILAFLTLAPAGNASASIEIKGPFIDPAHYHAGWTSAHHAVVRGENCIIFLFGLGRNNSVRCLHPSTGKFTYLQQNTEHSKGSIDGNGIDDRDNHLSLSIPGHGLFITGGAYLKNKPYSWGFFDYKRGAWTYRGNGSDIGKGIIDWGNYQVFNAAEAWSRKYNIGIFFNGESSGGTHRQVVQVTPKGDGTYSTKLLDVTGTPNCIRMRNSAVAVGDWIYVYGGICLVNHKRVDTAWFYRFNLVSHKWQKLADAPHARRMPQVTYDQVTHDIVVYGGGKNQYTPSNTVMTWNVDSQGPWEDRTAEARMPAVKLVQGAYDPATGWHCYRGGRWSDGSSDKVWCMRFAKGKGNATTAADSRTTVSLPSGRSDGSSLHRAASVKRPSSDWDEAPTLAQTGSVSLPPPGKILMPPPGRISLPGHSENMLHSSRRDHNISNVTSSDVKVTGTIEPKIIVRNIPPASAHISPVHNSKHTRFSEATSGDRRLYLISGDWGFADKYADSARQDTFSYDIFTDTWRRVVPYCTPDRQQPTNPDEVVQAWDTKRNVLWLGPGIFFTGSHPPCPGLLPMDEFDPKTGKWSRPPQQKLPDFLHKYRSTIRGLYDAKTDSVIMIHDRYGVQWTVADKTWHVFPHAWGSFSESPTAQVGRWVYVVNERRYILWRWNIDTHAFEQLGPLPETLRDGDGDDAGRVYMGSLGKYIAMYQEQNKYRKIVSHMYVLNTKDMSYIKVILPKGVRGNSFTWHSSGWGFLFGGYVGFDCCKHPMRHFYLIDLRRFGGTGESLK